jgi:hypothetical protein
MVTHRPGWMMLPVAWWTLQAVVLWRRRGPSVSACTTSLLPLADLGAFVVFLGGIVGQAEPS